VVRNAVAIAAVNAGDAGALPCSTFRNSDSDT
jgi:hypothetical protein